VKTSEFHGVMAAFSRRAGVDWCVLRTEKQRCGKKSHHLGRCGLILNQTGRQDFVEIPPKPSTLVNAPCA